MSVDLLQKGGAADKIAQGSADKTTFAYKYRKRGGFLKFKAGRMNLMSDKEKIFKKAEQYITDKSAEMTAFSDYMAAHPELSAEEFESSRMMTEKLREAGFEVEYPYLGLPTAFMAKKSSGAKKPVVALMVEYDALPEIGHACGHNLHGTMALYAGMAVGEAMGELIGELRVVGTPAEETDGAKVRMADEGVFDDVDFAIMFHSFAGESFADYRSVGIDGFDFTFTGQTSHSAASPWRGRSAQSGMLLFIDALNMLRIHMHDYCRLAAYITEVKGAVNIIPDRAVCRVEARAPELSVQEELTAAVLECARGAAIATRTEVSWEKFEGSFAPMLPNLTAEKLAEDTMAEYGVVCTRGHHPTGSTDVGNISLRCPAIQPEFAIAKEKLDLHTREFAAATTSGEGHEALVKGTRIMADICLKVFTDEELRNKIKAEFTAAKEQLQ